MSGSCKTSTSIGGQPAISLWYRSPVFQRYTVPSPPGNHA